MFYAASEIVFWILLAAVIGGGIGYGIAQVKMVRLNQRLASSRADAPLERELAIAWDTIEDLNTRLQVAHETIRGDYEPNEIAAVPDPDFEEQPDESAPSDDDLDEIVAAKMAKAENAKDGGADNAVIGTRLSERVASASRAKNVDFSDGLEG